MKNLRNRASFISALSGAFIFVGCGGGNVSDQLSNQINGGGSSSAVGSNPTSAACAKMSVGINGDLNGFQPLPANSAWNTDISNLPPAPNSAALMSNYIAHTGNSALQGDLGTQYGEYWNVVDSSVQPKQAIDINMYPTESDIVPIPGLHAGAIEVSSGGDLHMFVLDKNTCWLYETWGTTNNGTWHASNMAVWDLLNDSQRPYNWTSADAAGLPVFPGLVRYDEVARGSVNHAIRFTLKSSANAYVAPATHSAGSDSNSFPMGTRFRLKANFDISSFPAADQVILKAMKRYGVILADNGLDFEIAGTRDSRWNEPDVGALRGVHFSDMELITNGGAIVKTNPPAGPAPTINSFAASSATVSSGQPVTLTWSTANDSWDFIDVIGPVRGNSVTVNPTTTTTYTLNATNIHGRTKQAITVQVQ